MDDIIYMKSSQYLVNEFKLSMMSEFDTIYLGILYYSLGLEVCQVIMVFIFIKEIYV